MPRTLSPAAKAALFKQQTGEVFLTLLTLNHPSMSEPIRLVNDGRDLISRGATFQRFPFEITMPEETDGAPGPVRFRCANADRRIVLAIRQLSGELLKATLEVVMASAPDDLVAGPLEFTMASAPYSADVVEADLTFEDILNEAYPADEFNPSSTPGLF